MKRAFLPAFLLLMIAAAMPQTQSGWQSGKVLSFTSREWTTAADSGDGTQTRLTCKLILAAGQHSYTLQRDSPREKLPKFETNSDVKYIFDRADIIVRDATNREFRMRIVKDGPEAASASDIGATPAPSKAADGKTLVAVKSIPSGAQIFLNGSLVGITPANLQVVSGTYLLRVQLDSYSAWEKQILVAGGNLEFSAELQPQDVVLSDQGGSIAAAARAAKRQKQ